MVTKIVIPRIGGAAGPTEQALQEQGVEYQTRQVDTGAAYSTMLADLWREREGFLMIEHDVVPPEGAVLRLAVCPEPWCTHAYPGPQLFMSIGVLKITADAIQQAPELFTAWEGQPWGVVDSHVIPALHAHFPLHGHFPPFRHTRFE